MIPTVTPKPAEMHAVFVVLGDHSKHRVCDFTSWTEAIDLWTALDDQRRDAQKAGGRVFSGDREVRYYEVRAENDPAYQYLPVLHLERDFAVLSKQYTTDTAAAKAVLKPLGYYARTGGWVYFVSGNLERVLTQGWFQAASSTGHKVVRLEGEKGYRATVTTMLQVRVTVG